jgi:hypothetical protein
MTDLSPHSSNQPGLIKALGFGMYLASSWTWCIGMFLPLLLLRDYGLASFAAFALPNIIGAAAMGWVLRTRLQADAFASAHRTAARGFSFITILFHVFFITWLVKSTPWTAPLLEDGVSVAALGACTAGALLTLAWLLSRLSMPLMLAAAALAWVASLGLGLSLPRPSPEFIDAHAHTNPGLLWLAPVMVFGFGLCPYLDLTFLRARRSLEPSQSKLAFGIGFGVFFAVMIALTLHYSQVILGKSFGPFPLVLTIHMIVQAVFTVGVHLRELSRRAEPLAPGIGIKFIIAALGVGVASAILPPHDLRAVIWPPSLVPSSENIYRAFMSFYALVFPAYMLLAVLTRREGFTAPPTRGDIRVWLFTTAATAPFFALAVFTRQDIWYLPGMAILAIAYLWRRKSLAA